jgi:hypothetical protein
MITKDLDEGHHRFPSSTAGHDTNPHAPRPDKLSLQQKSNKHENDDEIINPTFDMGIRLAVVGWCFCCRLAFGC